MRKNKDDIKTLHFIVRSCVMGVLNGAMFLSIVFLLGSINTWQTLVIGLVLFVATLAITRVFHNQIDRATNFLLKYLEKYKFIRDFILNYL